MEPPPGGTHNADVDESTVDLFTEEQLPWVEEFRLRGGLFGTSWRHRGLFWVKKSMKILATHNMSFMDFCFTYPTMISTLFFGVQMANFQNVAMPWPQGVRKNTSLYIICCCWTLFLRKTHFCWYFLEHSPLMAAMACLTYNKKTLVVMQSTESKRLISNVRWRSPRSHRSRPTFRSPHRCCVGMRVIMTYPPGN